MLLRTMQNIPVTKISYQQYDATQNDAKYTCKKKYISNTMLLRTMQNTPVTKISYQQNDATQNDAKYTCNKNITSAI